MVHKKLGKILGDRAARGLGHNAVADDLGRMQLLLADRLAIVRVAAVVGVAALVDEDLVELLGPHLSDTDGRVRRAAAHHVAEDEHLRQSARETFVHVARARTAAHGAAAARLSDSPWTKVFDLI